MRAHKLLGETMANLRIDAFGKWYLERNDYAQLIDMSYFWGW